MDCGAGVSTSATAHLVDAEWHELYSKSATLTAGDAEELSNEKQCTTADEILQFAESKGGTWNNYEAKKNDSIDIMKCVCVDWQLYPIVRLNIGEKSTLGGILSNLKVNTSLEIVGSKNVALKGHIDWDKDGLSNFNNAKTGGDSWSKFKAVLGIGAECKYEFTPWDNGVELADESEPKDSPSIASGNRILLSTQRVTLDPGQTVTVQVDALPAGYTLKDLKTKCRGEEDCHVRCAQRRDYCGQEERRHKTGGVHGRRKIQGRVRNICDAKQQHRRWKLIEARKDYDSENVYGKRRPERHQAGFRVH